MSEKLQLAENYYTVAADLERQGRYMLDMANTLNQVADKLCEQNMKEQPPASTSNSCAEK